MAGNKRVAVMYSGGIDTTYICAKLVEQSIDVTAIFVNLSDHCNKDLLQKFAKMINMDLVIIDGVNRYCEHFIKKSIINSFFVDETYPISASLSFPLILDEVVRHAASLGIRDVIHGAEASQNAILRLSSARHFPGVNIVPYFLENPVSRDKKISYLDSIGVDIGGATLSRDSNIWAETIEGGYYDDYQTKICYADFLPKLIEAFEEKLLLIEFADGVPISLNGERMGIKEIIQYLNKISEGSRFGYCSAFERNGLSKVRELRYCPSGVVINACKRAAVNYCLSYEEIFHKSNLDKRWVEEAVSGRWGSALSEAINEFNICLAKKIKCFMYLRVCMDGVIVESVFGGAEVILNLSNEELIHTRRVQIKRNELDV